MSMVVVITKMNAIKINNQFQVCQRQYIFTHDFLGAKPQKSNDKCDLTWVSCPCTMTTIQRQGVLVIIATWHAIGNSRYKTNPQF